MLAKAGIVATVAGATLVGTLFTGTTPAHAILSAQLGGGALPEAPYVHLYRIGGNGTVKAGTRITFVGSVKHAGDQRPIASLPTYFQELRSNNRWVTIQTKYLHADGHVLYAVSPTRTKHYRLFFPPVRPYGRAQLYSANDSMTVRVPVRPAPTVTASTSTSTYYTATASASGIGQQIVNEAARHNGAPYVFGAAGPNSFDCSGLTMYVYGKFGVSLPHKANSQKAYGRAVSHSQMRPGDLMVFLDSSGYGYHAAIYAGGGKMWDATNPSVDTGLHSIWSSSYVVRRLIG
jgi:cell wall-associated NlpC family hydrolase